MAEHAVQHFVFIWTFLYLGQVVRTADISYMNRTIRSRFSEVRNHFVDPVVKDQAREFIYEEFQRFGLDTEYHNFEYVNPTKNLSGTFTNVVGIIKGTRFGTTADKIIGVWAHYDTVSTSNGVDDNGAGVAAMLEAARQLTQMHVTRKNTVIFASFDLEEYGLIGSERFIGYWVNPWLMKNYGQAAFSLKPHGVIVLDTMMEYNTSEFSQALPDEDAMKTFWPETYNSLKSDNFQGDFLTLIYRSNTPDDPLAGTFQTSWEDSGRDQFELESLGVPWDIDSPLRTEYAHMFGSLLRSDHVSFWDYSSVPSIFITDSANFRGDMQQCYHQMCDDIDTMLTYENLQFLGKTADVIAKTVDVLSEPENDDPSGVGSRACSKVVLVLVLLSIVAKTS